MKYLFLIASLLLFGKNGLAQERVSTYSEKKTSLWRVRIYENEPLNVREYTLNNGLTIITSGNPSEPRISTMIAVKTGSKNDPATNTGLAHYLEHMLFKGTDKYGSLDWSKEKPLLDQIDALYELYNHTTDTTKRKQIYHTIDSVSQLAAKWAIANEYDKMCQAIGAEGTNAFTSNEQTVYINDIPANMVFKWIELEAERFRNPVLRLFHTELEAVYEEKNMGLDRDATKVSEKLYSELFPKHNYGQQTTIGTIEHLKNPSLKAIREYYNKYYVPNNMAIILSGDFNADSVVSVIAEKFGYMQPKTVDPYTCDPEMIHGWPREFEVTGPDAEYVTIGYRLPGANTREARAARMIDLLLNNASAGLIDLNLVKKQMVLSAGSGVNTMNDYSVFTLSGKPREGQTLDSVKHLLLIQMKKIQDGEFEDSMLQAILLNEDISRIGGYKYNGNRCSFLMDGFVSNAGYMKSFNELWEMKKLHKEEIQEIAREFLGNDHVVIYKRKGTDSTVQKIVKPEIHPVELNRDKQSEFVTKWLAEPTATIEPVFVNFEKSISKETLGAECQIYYVKNKDNRLFTLQYRYEYGRYHNKALPFAMDYLKYLGTSGMSAESFSKKMYALGCSFSAVCGDKRSYVTLTGPEENFDAALKLFENLLANARADEGAFKDMIQGELKKRSDAKLSNRAIAGRLSQYALYGADNPARWVLSNAELEGLKATQLTDLLHGLYRKNHTVEYYGSRSLPDLKTALGSLHKLPAAFDKAEVAKQFVPRQNKENEVFFTNYKQVQASIYWWNRDEIYNPDDEPVITLFNQYFGGDMSSVVFQNIREAKALAYSTYAAYITPDMAGEYNRSFAFIGCQADKFKDAFDAMDELLQKLTVDENVFALAKESIVNKMKTERYGDESLVGYYFSLKDLGISKDPREKLYKAVPGISLKDIEQFHKAHISGKHHSIAIVANAELIKPKDLEKYGKLTQVNLDELFGY